MTIPALRQSLVETMACPERYVFEVIQGNKMPPSMQSERGTEVHHIMSEYVRHCVKRRVKADYAELDRLSAAAGPVAGPIIDNMRDSYEVDWEHVYGTEITLAMNEDLDARWPESYSGTLDVILINDAGDEAEIPDYKSHPRPFEPDTFQSMLYPFMLMKHLPSLKKVTFTLIFVRWGGKVRRSCQWTRDDMPEMAKEIQRARARQKALHAVGEGPALPGVGCQYCPKLTKPTLCSISEFNPEINTGMAERLRFNVWASQHAKLNNAILKDYVDATGKPVRIVDGNGKITEYGIQATEAKAIPLEGAAIKLLNDWTKATGEDWKAWKLRISSTALMSKLKAKKRAALLEQFEDSIIEMEVKPKFAVRHPDGDVDTGYNPEEGF